MLVCLLPGIKKIFPDISGTHLAFIDEKSDGFVYNPVSILLDASLVNKWERFLSGAAVCLYSDLLWKRVVAWSLQLLGRFSFDQIYFSFPGISRGKWNIIFRNFRKRGQPFGVNRNVRKFLPEISVPFDIPTNGISGIVGGGMVHFSKI